MMRLVSAGKTKAILGKNIVEPDSVIKSLSRRRGAESREKKKSRIAHPFFELFSTPFQT